MREDGRQLSEMRPVKVTRNFLKYGEGSVLIEVGDTHVICTASVEEKVPPFLKGTGKGWITSEYAMLPRATAVRTVRESSKGKVTGRTQEIQRLIGRALRSVVDLSKLGERTIWIDCDVIQADGGTRTASITGSYVALLDALIKISQTEKWDRLPVFDWLAAISVGKINDSLMLDLCYNEDSQADVDMNVVMTGSGKFVEVQGTAEAQPFSRLEMEQMLGLAEQGIQKLIAIQQELFREELEFKYAGDRLSN